MCRRHALQVLEGIKAGIVTIRPGRLDGIATHRSQFDQLKGIRSERFFRIFVNIPKNIRLAFTTGAGTGAAEIFQGKKLLGAVFPFDGQFGSYELNIQRSH